MYGASWKKIFFSPKSVPFSPQALLWSTKAKLAPHKSVKFATQFQEKQQLKKFETFASKNSHNFRCQMWQQRWNQKRKRKKERKSVSVKKYYTGLKGVATTVICNLIQVTALTPFSLCTHISVQQQNTKRCISACSYLLSKQCW